MTSKPLSPFQRHWLTETIRLRESQWGPLQDATETRHVRKDGTSVQQRIMQRADLLGRRERLDRVIQQWAKGARLALLLLLIIAIIAGIGAALGTLGDSRRQVNLLLALVTLLGLHALSFAVWLATLALPASDGQAILGELWLWLTRKLARGPQAALALRALIGLLLRRRILRPMLGSISHLWWLLALATMLLTLLALLSARRYTFSWETTLLSPEAFVGLTHWLGWLPQKLGFAIPSEEIIRMSDGLHTLPDSAHALWSSWLIACVLFYGLVPRAVALLVTAWLCWRRSRRLHIDLSLPGFAELVERLDPPSIAGDIDAAALPRVLTPPIQRSTGRTAPSGDVLVIGLELPTDEAWPPLELGPTITDLGVIDTREQRQRLLSRLLDRSPDKLLVVCDARQSPDRGSLSLLREMSSLVGQLHIALHGPTPARHASKARPTPAHERDTEHGLKRWHEQLASAGFTTQQIHSDVASGIQWLSLGNTAATDFAP